MGNIDDFHSSVIDDICEAAIISQTFARNQSVKYEKEVSENTLISPFSTRSIVSIFDKPISFAQFTDKEAGVRATKGTYFIRYYPENHKRRVKGKPYVISQDLILMKVAVSGPRHWGALCDRIPELGWLRRNSTFTDDMFAIAKKHPGLMIPFCLDVSKYCKKIEEQAAEQGLDIDHKPLVAYQCSGKDYVNIYSKKELCELKTKADYFNEINEAEQEAKGEK